MLGTNLWSILNSSFLYIFSVVGVGSIHRLFMLTRQTHAQVLKLFFKIPNTNFLWENIFTEYLATKTNYFTENETNEFFFPPKHTILIVDKVFIYPAFV